MRAIYSANLYVGEGIESRKLEKLKQKIEKKPLLCSAYLVGISRHPKDQLDIIQARQLFWRYYTENPVRVVGIFEDYEEAVDWIAESLNTCMEHQGNCNLKEYFECQFS